jgi:hypothetical protein
VAHFRKGGIILRNVLILISAFIIFLTGCGGNMQTNSSPAQETKQDTKSEIHGPGSPPYTQQEKEYVKILAPVVDSLEKMYDTITTTNASSPKVNETAEKIYKILNDESNRPSLGTNMGNMNYYLSLACKDLEMVNISLATSSRTQLKDHMEAFKKDIKRFRSLSHAIETDTEFLDE